MEIKYDGKTQIPTSHIILYARLLVRNKVYNNAAAAVRAISNNEVDLSNIEEKLIQYEQKPAEEDELVEYE